MSDNSKKVKLVLLQNFYKELSNILFNLNNHINYLYDNFFIEYNFKQSMLLKLNEINKNINTSYNNFIVEKLELGNEMDIWFNSLNKLDLNENSIKDLLEFSKFIDIKDLPLSKEISEVGQIISSLGYSDINGILSFFVGNNYKLFLNENTIKLLNEIQHIFIPISIDFFDVNKDDPHYWRKPQNFDENDLLQVSRELWIKYNKKYIKIVGTFKNDSLGVIFKTAQLNYPILYSSKTLIEEEIEKFSIDKKFIRKFLRHDYIGNFYTSTPVEYLMNLEKYYQKFIELSSSTFLTIMKEFIAESSDLRKMFDIVFLLLLGNEETIDIASLLLGLTKEKKSNSPNIYNIINNNLSFSLQVKLKKNQNNIKNELEKIKSLTSEDIDYKKQLVTNKNIPNNVKSLTLEKIQEMKLYNNEYYKQLTFVKYIMNFPWPSDNDDLFYESLKNNSKNSIDYLTTVQ